MPESCEPECLCPPLPHQPDRRSLAGTRVYVLLLRTFFFLRLPDVPLLYFADFDLEPLSVFRRCPLVGAAVALRFEPSFFQLFFLAPISTLRKSSVSSSP